MIMACETRTMTNMTYIQTAKKFADSTSLDDKILGQKCKNHKNMVSRGIFVDNILCDCDDDDEDDEEDDGDDDYNDDDDVGRQHGQVLCWLLYDCKTVRLYDCKTI